MLIKLQRKILLMNMFLISIVMLLAFVTIYAIIWQSVQTENQRKLETQMPSFTLNSEDDALPNGIAPTVSHTISPEYAPSFSIEIDDYGNILYINSIINMPMEVYTEATRMALAQNRSTGTIVLENKGWMYKVGHSSNIQIKNGIRNVIQGGKYISFLDITESRITMRNLLIVLSAVGTVVLIIFYFISLFFSRHVIKPVAVAWEKQKRFVADASHELRTPLSIINSNRDALIENRHETIESQIKWLNYIRIGTDRMENLIGRLLLLAKMDEPGVTIVNKSINISHLILEVTRSMEAVAGEKNLNLVYNIEPDIIIKSDSEKISEILTILLENATKYADSYIDVRLKKTKRHICFTVKNDGKGIIQEDLSKVFDRFYRGDKSRGESGGFGLGLSIAKTIVESLDGKILVDSKINDYTVFIVSIPI